MLRSVVDQVHPALMGYGLRLTDRGSHPDVNWVEYQATPVAGGLTARQTRLIVSHFMAHRSVAVGLCWYDNLAPRAAARASQGWEYRPGTDQTFSGRTLASDVAAWVSAAMVRGPAPETATD
jgi:hypothetical protein